MELDVLIAGAGPAGLSAALVLGRCHRKVLLCGEARQRNRSSHAIHGLLGHEGCAPAAYLEAGQAELARYPAISLRSTKVTDLVRRGLGFAFTCDDGTRGTARKILLATGIVDELPQIPGVENFYGISVHHCLYCDGFEYKNRPVAAYGKGDKGADLALMMRHWISDVVVCTDGDLLSGKTTEKLFARKSLSVKNPSHL